MSSHAYPRVRVVAVLLVTAALAHLVLACGETETPPPVSLNGPLQITVASTCLVGSGTERLRVAASRCDAGEFGDEPTTLLEYGYVTNAFGNSVGVVDFNLRTPELIDIDPTTPGITHIPVGEQPREVAASADGNLIFTLNADSRDLSIVSGATWREIARVPVGDLATGLVAAPDRDAVWFLLTDRDRLVELRYTATCAGSDEIVTHCDIEVETELVEVFAFDDDSLPVHLAAVPDSHRLLVGFAHRPYLTEVLVEAEEGDAPPTCLNGAEPPCASARYGLTWGCSDGIDNDGDGLIDAQDPECFEPDDAESPDGVGRGHTGPCTDGLDNDGDGLIDAQDPGCLDASDASETGAVLSVACSDGLDNDDDGLVDADDPECQLPATGAWTPGHTSEAARPACSDGIDNNDDGLTDADDPDCVDPNHDDEVTRPACSDNLDNDNDGLKDAEDPDCAGPLGRSEDGSIPACSDGIDNDGDGAIDLDDPACQGRGTSSERQAPGPCADGADNDGDGLIDDADPDCYGVSGGTESSIPTFDYGAIAVDPGGRFAYVIDHTNTQLVVLDLVEHRTWDVAVDRPYDSRIGIPVGRLPISLAARRIKATTATSTDERYRIERATLFVNVATTRGNIFYVEIGDLWQAFDGEEVTQELFDPIMRVSDLDTADAFASTPHCTIPERLAAQVAEPSGALPACTSGVFPQLAPYDLPDPTTGEAQPTVRLPTRERSLLTLGADQAPTVETERFPDDFYVRDEAWTLTYEGALAQPTDLEVIEPGVLLSQGTSFCRTGVELGDLLTLTTPATPRIVDGQAEPDCSAFDNVDLTFRVVNRSASYLFIAPLSAAEVTALDRAPDALPAATTLPTRECFAQGLSADLWSEKTWIVSGDRTGKLVNQTSLGQACVPLHDVDDLGYRVKTGDLYANPFVAFRVAPGSVEPTHGFALDFAVTSRYRPLTIDATGPAPIGLAYVETRQGAYLPVVDGGTYVIRVYDANTNRLLTVLF